MQNQDKLQPHSIEAEESVLGGILIDNDAMLDLPPGLEASSFFIRRHGLIFDAMMELHANRQPIDLVLLTDLLTKRNQLDDIGGGAMLNDLINAVPTSINTAHYAGIVERTSILRRLIATAADLAQKAYQDGDAPETIIAEAVAGLTGAMPDTIGRTQTMSQAIDSLYDEIEHIKAHPDMIIGLPTGLTDLDKMLGGLQRSDLIVIAGRPGMGKTALAIQIAKNTATAHRARGLVFSLEMSTKQLMQRMVSQDIKVPTNRIRNGDFNEDEWTNFVGATSALSALPITVNDTPAITVSAIRAAALRQQAMHGLDLIVIDYLQIMGGDKRSENRVREISEMTMQLKTLARELNIPIILLSQLSRAVESRADRRPVLSDLRDSGSIEQDADVVIFVYREEEYNPDTERPSIMDLIIRKHRNGATGEFEVYFDKRHTAVHSLELRTTPLDWASA